MSRTKWTSAEEALLQRELNKVATVNDLPFLTLQTKLDRTYKSVLNKALRMKKDPLYEWDKVEVQTAFEMYLNDVPTTKILQEIANMGSTCTLAQLDKKMMELRWRVADALRAFAREEGLWEPKNPSTELLRAFAYRTEETMGSLRKLLRG